METSKINYFEDICPKYEIVDFGGIRSHLFYFYRVKKGNLKILFAQYGEKFYGGIRYSNDKQELEIMEYLPYEILDGMKPTNELKLHFTKGRKVQWLKRFDLISVEGNDRGSITADSNLDKEVA